jgi:hypothetical protein
MRTKCKENEEEIYTKQAEVGPVCNLKSELGTGASTIKIFKICLKAIVGFVGKYLPYAFPVQDGLKQGDTS